MIEVPYSHLIDSNIELKDLSDSITEIGNQAIKEIIEKNKEAGVATVFSFDNGIIYQLPDGKITKVSPFESAETSVPNAFLF